MDQPQPAPTTPPPRAMTWRAVGIGLFLVAVIAVLTPINDWYLNNTFFYSQHLPVGVLLLVVLFGLGINPLLGRFRLRAGEMLVVTGMLLVLGGVVSSGLNRVFVGVIAGPARLAASGTEIAALVPEEGPGAFPRGPYLGLRQSGRPDATDPEHRYVVDGFWSGLGSAQPAVRHRATVTWSDGGGPPTTALALDAGAGGTDLDLASPVGLALAGQRVGARVPGPGGQLVVIAIEPPPIPWAPWAWALLHWTPLLGSALICFLAMAALVRQQWVHHERLPYPIANVLATYLDDPAPGQRLAPIFRQRSFWIGFAVAALVLTSQGLSAYGWNAFPIPTTLDLNPTLQGPPWNQVWSGYGLYTLRIFFSIVALTFFLPTDLSLSLWLFYVLTNVVTAILRSSGVPVEWQDPSTATIGGYVIEVILVLWIGRTYYLRVLRAAFGLARDPDLRVVAVYAWLFFAGLAGLIATMVAYGAPVGYAGLAAMVYLGTALVLARLIAEAGIPFLNSPTWWDSSNVIFSLTGFALPAAALLPLTMLAQTLTGDSREHVLPFATNAEWLGERAGVRRLPWTLLLLVVLALGTVIAGVTMLVLTYQRDGMNNLNDLWKRTLMSGAGPLNSAASGGSVQDPQRTWTLYGIGAGITGGLGVARLAWAWWPLHPLGYLASATFATSMVWFSFFVGWLLKSGVMRYGGMQLYRWMKPVAYGLIAGEAAIAGIFLILGLLNAAFGWGLPPAPKFLPY